MVDIERGLPISSEVSYYNCMAEEDVINVTPILQIVPNCHSSQVSLVHQSCEYDRKASYSMPGEKTEIEYLANFS